MKNPIVFKIINNIILYGLAFLCLFPLIHILAISLSSSVAATAGKVGLWPVNFTMYSYQFVMRKPEIPQAFMTSFKRLFLGVPLNMLLTILAAYPLSKTRQQFKRRKFYVWFFFITMLFNGGLIPWYMTINTLGLMNTIWALILPGAVPVFNVILLLNFFRSLPNELEEAAFVDGANHMHVLWRIIVPISMPAVATLTLFCIVGHWNSWFDGIILMNDPKNYPLQSYLQTIIAARDMSLYQNASREELEVLSQISDRTTKAAQIFITIIPVLMIYPFLQRFFIKGIVLGAVKG